MFSRSLDWWACYAVAALLWLLVVRCQADIITEGDAVFDGSIQVAQQSEDGSFTITAPTHLEGEGILVAGHPDSTGSVVVDGGSYASGSQNFQIGIQGHGSLEIINGGRVTSNVSNVLFAGQPRGGSGEVLVSGPNSSLDMPRARATIGAFSIGSLVIERGGYAAHASAYIGTSNNRGGGEGLAVVRGPGSRWDVLGELVAISGTLSIQDGGVVHSGGEAAIGSFAAPGYAVVDGAGSIWQHTGSTAISSGTLTIRDGANVSTDELVVGILGSEPSRDSSVIVDGRGSRLTVGRLQLQREGVNQVLVSDGARLDTVSTRIPQGQYIVRGAGSRWETFVGLQTTIGDEGHVELIIEDGAAVTHCRVVLGRREYHATVKVAGAGSNWWVDDLEIGEAGRLELDQGTVLQSLSRLRFMEIKNRGIIHGSGTILHSVDNSIGGRIQIGPNQRLVIDALQNGPQAGIDIFGGELEVRTDFANLSQGVVSILDGTLRVPRPLTGRLPRNSAIINAFGDNQFFGRLVNDGELRVSGVGITTFHDDVLNQGLLQVAIGSEATFLGELSANGVAGGGSVSLEGGISPGLDLTSMEFGGDVALGEFSKLNIDVSNAAHGALDVRGSATLGGTLNLNPLGPLQEDADFVLLSASSLAGTFDQVPEIGDSLGSGVRFGGISYGSDSVVVSLLATTGDFNRDGDVNGSDFLTWQRSGGSDTSLADWQGDFGVGGSLASANLAIPEPTGAALLILAGGLALAVSRPRGAA